MKVNIENVEIPKEVEKVIVNSFYLYCKGILNKYNKGDKSIWIRVTEDNGDILVSLASPRKKNIEERYSLNKLVKREFNSSEKYCKYLYNILKIFTDLDLNVDKLSVNVKNHVFKSMFVTSFA